ncbi:thioesterase [Nostocoides sp. F2B08]|uniref:thioesterase family protein n=1 Tax=Nostocoides sp. F2B08 TaxID=2653936 RepID=UPI001262F05D|nr:thioesterase family protein [Tetrasphaera sp. F2B08]KAB7746387.1 thioesterase [Tetrasphaera sp. F2B08]
MSSSSTTRPPRAAFPSLDQVLALPSEYRVVVPHEFSDGNGHMNIARYMQLHSDGGWAYFARFGLSEESAAAGGPTTFDVEHHIVYRREVLAGHDVSVHVRLIDRSDTALHSLQFLVNRTTGEVANSHEALSLSVDLRTRTIAPIPQDLASLLDARLAVDRSLDWDPPLSGAMAVRRRPG